MALKKQGLLCREIRPQEGPALSGYSTATMTGFSKSTRSGEGRGLGRGEGLPSWTPDSGMVVTMAVGDSGNQLQCWQLRGPWSKTGLRLK